MSRRDLETWIGTLYDARPDLPLLRYEALPDEGALLLPDAARVGGEHAQFGHAYFETLTLIRRIDS